MVKHAMIKHAVISVFRSCSETGSHYIAQAGLTIVAQAGLRLIVFLPQSLRY